VTQVQHGPTPAGRRYVLAAPAAKFVAEGSAPTFIGVGADLMSGTAFIGFHADDSPDDQASPLGHAPRGSGASRPGVEGSSIVAPDGGLVRFVRVG
jgi:hypothetical protein